MHLATLFAQTVNEQPNTTTLIIELVVAIATIAGWWKAFEKAGRPGWASIIPIYNLVVFLQIIGRNPWLVLVAFIPLVNIIFFIIWYIDFAKAFGQGAGFGLGLVFLPFIFWPILGFGGSQYQGRPA